MSSIIEGYSYDIFISYRQKDNKYDGWVTEFVDNLKKELEATFKEEISVYFDINPHDGLLETHDVDASLKDKLKCLVFIPIISRTYCDPKSFAWEHEFKAFIEQASQDKFGLKVKLPNGNVASRVLPIRIYDLDSPDIKLCETVLGSALRGVEFIYKEAGVNRPLKSDDDEKTNLNKTKYRNQINKVGNAIKEVITGLKTEPVELGKEKPQVKGPLEEVKKEERKGIQEIPAKLPKKTLLSGSIVLAVLFIIAAILVYPKIFKQNTLERLRSSGDKISVAVMPFKNMTNDTTKKFWQEMIQDNLISLLSNYNYEGLKVRQLESINPLIQSKGLINYASITPSVASNISQKLYANVFVYGSINQAGSTIRLNAQLINSKTEEVFKSFQINGTTENIFPVIDSLSIMIRNFLIVSKLEKQTWPDFQHIGSTNSPEAYRYYINGMNALFKWDNATASSFLLKAVAADSNFFSAKLSLPFAFFNQGLNEEARKWCLKLYKIQDQLSGQQKLLVNFTYAYLFGPPYEEIKYLKQYLEVDDQSANFIFHLGFAYQKLQQYDKAIPEFERSLELFNKWGIKPYMNVWYICLADCYHLTGQYKKEKLLYIKAKKDFPDDPYLIGYQASLSLAEKDTVAANQYIGRLISICKEDSWSEADITTNLASVYSRAGILDKAGKYFRQALFLEPENAWKLIDLAWFLIDNDRNVNEGIELIDKALAIFHEIKPDNYYLFHYKGWGLYKKGKYKEALEWLEKSWELKPIYDHGLYLHLEEVKKAVAGQKNN